MLRLLAAEERDDADSAAGPFLVGEVRRGSICNCLCFLVVPVMRVTHPAFDINIDQRRLNALGGSWNPERQNLVLIERTIRIRNDRRDTAEVFPQHYLISGKDASCQIIER